MKKREDEKAIATLQRRLEILTMFNRKNQELTTREITRKLLDQGDVITDHSVLCNLKLLEKAGCLEAVNVHGDDELNDEEWDQALDRPSRKNLKWRWPLGFDPRIKVLPKLTMGEAIAFRFVELLLKPLLPRDSWEALQPYLTAVQKQRQLHPTWRKADQWENKVRVMMATQPLLAPCSPCQESVRETVLEALFRDRQCRITYQIIQRDETVEWIIHPLVYVQRGPAFYLLCLIEDCVAVKGLALHRMRSAEVLDGPARKPEGFNDPAEIDRVVERNQGMGGSHALIRLVARFRREAGLHLQETRLSDDQVVVDRDGDPDHLRLAATVRDTAQLRWWLLSFGSNVEVFEPATLRADLAQHARSMHQTYAQAA